MQYIFFITYPKMIWVTTELRKKFYILQIYQYIFTYFQDKAV